MYKQEQDQNSPSTPRSPYNLIDKKSFLKMFCKIKQYKVFSNNSELSLNFRTKDKAKQICVLKKQKVKMVRDMKSQLLPEQSFGQSNEEYYVFQNQLPKEKKKKLKIKNKLESKEAFKKLNSQGSSRLAYFTKEYSIFNL